MNKLIESHRTPLVSVIIPTYGRPHFLEKALDSILSQSYKNIEIIVVDDNPNNSNHKKTKEIINKHKHKHKHKIIYIFDGINVGGSLARNKGIIESKGEYITFLDDDDIYLKYKVEKQVEHIINNNLDVSVCNMFFKKNDKFLEISNCYSRVGSIQEFILNGNAYTPMIMSKRKSLLDVGLFTHSPRYQDHILMLKLFMADKKIKSLNEKLFIHNDHNEQRITYSNKSEEAYKIRQLYEKQNLYRLNFKEKKQYKIIELLITAKILRAKKNYFKSLKNIFFSFMYITNKNDLYKIIKTLVRIHIFPNKNI
ncbi:glycosyltransferase family 2 protein [Proteus mirabilis]|uniref:glycosyltransferase family 2 protein n=1 Tax=Proteus mirabilis TaxID=584 RepID=UPI0018C53C41|nr:glycosyltransferase family 2 protein [Proteus mirabilis]ELB4603088.1 glycosyltransferase family 2 protein [Proteus mirabilis]EMF1949451.1 glycosyltransferase family 2 protein [Proteus mirabilis]MBG2927918.1 glycosyltransferase family 2 protein [Proteus mirabilis]MDM3553678.1 glycosyltransferase family 2 protein [Proteus mirabilis]HCT6318207.1 glycosyltransferase family 2 protein [Proteus mirabilis]